jgi:putative transposase
MAPEGRWQVCSGVQCERLMRQLARPRSLPRAFNSLFKDELIRNMGPWTGIDDVEVAVAGYVDWFNQPRLRGELGHVPRAEYEEHFHTATPAPDNLPKTS